MLKCKALLIAIPDKKLYSKTFLKSFKEDKPPPNIIGIDSFPFNFSNKCQSSPFKVPSLSAEVINSSPTPESCNSNA